MSNKTWKVFNFRTNFLMIFSNFYVENLTF
jgi:hypothetical protein